MTLTEIVLALALTVSVVAAAVSLIEPAHTALSVRVQTDDLSQRARVGFMSFHQAFLNAASHTGLARREGTGIPLRPAVIPSRWGLRGRFEADAVTLIATTATDPQVVTGVSLEGPVGVLQLPPGEGCPFARPACELDVGTAALIFDRQGRSDLLRITDVLGRVISVASMEGPALPVYPAGSWIMPVDVHSFYFDRARGQVRHHDGWKTDAPVLDNVVALSFQYFGTPSEPILERGGEQPTCPAIARSARPAVELSLIALSDGPWCGTRPRFDVDLFRVRRVRITFRLQASAVEHRGSDRRLFARPGPGVDYKRLVPDDTVRFDVALR